jgi:hypothetical protein
MSFVITGPNKDMTRALSTDSKEKTDGKKPIEKFVPGLEVSADCKVPFKTVRDRTFGDWPWMVVHFCGIRTSYLTLTLVIAKAKQKGIDLTIVKTVGAPDGVIPHYSVGGTGVVAGDDRLTSILNLLAPFFMEAYECATFIHYPSAGVDPRRTRHLQAMGGHDPRRAEEEPSPEEEQKKDDEKNRDARRPAGPRGPARRGEEDLGRGTCPANPLGHDAPSCESRSSETPEPRKKKPARE